MSPEVGRDRIDASVSVSTHTRDLSLVRNTLNTVSHCDFSSRKKRGPIVAAVT